MDSQAFSSAIQYLRKTGGLIRWMKIAGTVLGAGLIAASPWIGGQEFQQSEAVETGMLIVGLALSVLSSLALVFVDQTTPELLEENLQILRENQLLKDDLGYAYKYQDHLLARTTVNSQVRELVETAVVEGCDTIDQASRFARSILSIFVERRLSLFGIGDEYWNFGVYLYDADQDRLVCIACRRESKEEEEQQHRNWEPGNGHVGLAFSRAAEIIFADATTPELRPVLEAQGDNKRNDDTERYVSLASIPISTDGTKPLGVLIATSNTPGRFKSDQERTPDDWENTDTLREVAASLAIILQMIHASEKAGGSGNDRFRGSGASCAS
jgi:hypothetical protein